MHVKRFDTSEIILLVDTAGAVQYVALDIPHLRHILTQNYPDCTPVTGELAGILYEALTGHSYIDHRLPENPASCARDALKMMFKHTNDPQFPTALRAVAAMTQLRPMMGITEFDADGRIIPSPTLVDFTHKITVPRARTHAHARTTV